MHQHVDREYLTESADPLDTIFGGYGHYLYQRRQNFPPRDLMYIIIFVLVDDK